MRGLSKNVCVRDVIMQIKKQINKGSQMFKKAFSKLCGHSREVVSASCPHGVVYAVKFVLHAESPRDYVDIILSMKHQPNIVVVDMANLVAAHGNNRKFGLFSTHNGMPVEASTANIEAASDHTLTVNLK